MGQITVSVPGGVVDVVFDSTEVGLLSSTCFRFSCSWWHNTEMILSCVCAACLAGAIDPIIRTG